MFEENVRAIASGSRVACFRQCAMRRDKFGKRRVAFMLRVNVERDDAGCCACCDADVGIRPLREPLVNNGFIGSRFVLPFVDARMLADARTLRALLS